MTGIQGKDGSWYQYNDSLGMIIKDGVVQPTTDYEPLFVPGSIEFCGILCKLTKQVISMTGDVAEFRNIPDID